SVICGPIGCAIDFVCRLLHLKIISLKKPLQIGLCNKASDNQLNNQHSTFVINTQQFLLEQSFNLLITAIVK
ncbi:hypothetical protein ABLT93_14025, partial [Acinetobacter soli]